LGYVCASSAAWHPGSPHPRESMSTFYPLFYGPDVRDMDRVYQLMSEQAQFWTDSWDETESTARKPIWGNSNSIYHPRRPAHDQTLPLPPAPATDLSYHSTWVEQNRRRIDLAAEFLQGNDELLGLLYQNLRLATLNKYNLEVYLTIAQLCRQNLQMIEGIQRMDEALTAAAKLRVRKPKEALAEVDRALHIADSIWHQRNGALKDATATWYESWLPHVSEANGRKFLHELDDVKDHLPDRTVDMSYLVYRETLLPLGSWVNAITAARNQFATANHLVTRTGNMNWSLLTPLPNQ
jgi:hexosaminidase